MNKLHLAFITLIFATPAFAALKQVRITTKLVVEGKVLSNPKITATMGEKSTVKQDAADGQSVLGMTVTPTEADDGTGRVQLRLEFFGNRFGSKREKVVLRYGEEVPMTFYSGNGELVEATVKVQKVKKAL